MSDFLRTVLSELIAYPERLRVRFPQPALPSPPLALTVPFPRLEIVLDGTLTEHCLPLGEQAMTQHQVLYVQSGKWSYPEWAAPATTLSILFSKQKLGFSLQRWDGEQLTEIHKQHVPRLGPRVGSYLLMALNEIAIKPDPVTVQFVMVGLLGHCLEQLSIQSPQVTKSRELFLTIQDYLEENASSALTRESVARRFHITPNYLSHLFQKSGSMGFNEYLTAVRLEQAKKLLRGYDLKIKEIAHGCGFIDSNYFCRIFKKHTARSPSEYRRHCRRVL